VEHTHKTDKEAVAKGLGYTSLNGASLGIIGTLRQYGLLQEEGDGLRVSPDVMALTMLPKGEPERIEAVQRAAYTPRLFSELRETYGETLPSDTSLRYALIKKGYTEKAANEVIRVYRDTLEFVSEETAGYTDADIEDQQEVEPPMTQPTADKQPLNYQDITSILSRLNSAPSESPNKTILQFKVSETSEARIELTGDVTQEAIERLALILDAQKLVFPKESQLRSPAVEQPAEQPTADMSSSE
jgi:hypothetical protein